MTSLRSLFVLFHGTTITPLLAEPVISEFMASNQNGATDENGSRPDWIEIRNPDATPVVMTGWALTDSAQDLQKWLFPAVTIPPNGHLLVFASGNDRRTVGQNLHTNFSLSAGGEYLALVRPDGTRSSEWAQYPQQYPDISYGTSNSTSDVTWVQQSTAVKVFVPADTSLIPQWRSIGFNDAAWTAGTFGVGYMNSGASPNLSADLGVNLATSMSGTSKHSYSRAQFNVPDKAAVLSIKLRMNYDDGFVAWINGVLAANSNGAPTTDPISNTATVGSHNPGTFEDFTVAPAALAALVNGNNVLAIENFNTSTTSSDAIVIPQLIGSLNAAGAGVTGYFTVATPGTGNGGVNTIQLPQNVVFSREPGTYSAPFTLTLSGNLPGQEIRYVITDPSGTGATAAQPTASSTLYNPATPISLTMTNGKLIRAAIFEGSQKSRTATAQYLPLETGTTNNTSNFTSQLPIIVMDDHGAGQPVDSGGNSYTSSLMHVFPTVNGTARLSDAGTGNGIPAVFTRAGTRVRGSSSAGLAKKTYGMETWDEVNVDKDVAILGLSENSDWILSGPSLFDDTFIHNAYIFEVSRRIGRWAPRTVAVEMFFNQNGGKLDYSDYAGVYILTEKIKSGKDRLDIAGIEPGDNTGSALTGGYIFKIDRADGGEYSWTISNTSFGLGTLPNQESGQSLVLVEPDPDFDTAQQQDYIRNTAILQWNNALFTDRAANYTSRNYRNHIDVGAFVDHHLLNSLAYNVDALRLSAFYFKDRNNKIHAGPIWDFDRALGSDDGRDANPSSWGNIQYFFDRDWWLGLFKDPQFVQEVVDRWWQLRQPGQPFEQPVLMALADQMGTQIGNTAGARDAARWPDDAAQGGVYLNEITAMKNWLTSRGTFIDNAAPRPPDTNVASGPVTAGTPVTLSGTGTIRYTLDGTDPRPFGGATPGTGSTYTAPVVINSTTVLTARRQGTFTPFPQGAASISWSAPRTRVYLVNEFFAVSGDLAVSEVNYHPAAPTPMEAAAAPNTVADDYEWIELKNIGTRTVNTFEMVVPAGYPFEKELRLAPRSIAPGETALIVKNRTAFQARYGTSQNTKIIGEWGEGSMDDSGEELRLLARDNSTVASFSYGDGSGWPDRADGHGAALEYTGPAYTTADYNLAANWRSSSELHGSPGANGAGPDTRVVINEVLSHSNSPRVDAIELRNNSASPVDVSGWFISDAGDIETALEYQKFAIPAGTVIPAGGYAVFTETSFNPNGAWNPSPGTPEANEFAFDGQHGDDAWLLSNTGGVLRFVDHVEFGASRPDETWGRLPNGTGALTPLVTRTLLNEGSATTPRPGQGADNSGSRTGPLVIQEIQHAPPGAENDLEFVEILNPTTAEVSLMNWRLRGDVDYNFAAESIPAGGVIVVVPFAPSDEARASVFRASYGIDQSVVLAGPWDGSDHLTTNGTVTLYRAESPPVAEPFYNPMTTEDQVNYRGNSNGWPDTTGGMTLNRGVRDFGSSAGNWIAAAPTPGNVSLNYSGWKALYFPSGGPGSGDHDDPDLDGMDNALEFVLGLSPVAASNTANLLPQLSTQPGGGGGTDYVFTFTRSLSIPGVTCTVEKSTNLQSWTTVSDTVISTTSLIETRQATVNVAGTGRIYMRLKVTVQP